MPLEQVYRIFLCIVIIVNPVKAGGIPGKGRIFSVSSQEIEDRVGTYFNFTAQFFLTVIPGAFKGFNLLGSICSDLMVDNNIGVNLHSGFMTGTNGIRVFPPGSVFGRNGALLVKFTQIVKIIGSIADIVNPARSLESRRKPESRNSGIRKLCSFPGHFFPE